MGLQESHNQLTPCCRLQTSTLLDDIPPRLRQIGQVRFWLGEEGGREGGGGGGGGGGACAKAYL